MNVDFSNLLFTNKDTVAWIYLRNTNINYPVLQTINNDYYLNHSFDKSYNDAGWVFLDYRNDFNTSLNNIIYGHSRYDGSVFGTLRNVLEESFLKDKNNHIIKISTPTANTLWQIYSVYTIKEETYYIKTDFASDEYKTWQNDMLKRSIYNFNTTLLDNDRTLTLSSCYNNEDVRVVVYAKLIKELKRD